jgi:transcription elongation factor S-II
MSSAGNMQTVLNVKEALVKELPISDGDDGAVERCGDLLDRLADARINLAILAETLIGATVNKLKSHKVLGPKAKELVKGWKAVAAKEQQQQGPGGDDDAPTAATVASGAAKRDSKVNLERRESLESTKSGEEGSYDPESEWSGLPDPRNTICKKLYQILLMAKPTLLKEGVNEAAVLHLVGPRAAELEQALQDKFRSDRRGYTDKARSICFNLKKNGPLSADLVLGHVEPTELVNFTSEQLASDEMRLKREETAKKLIDSRRLDWDQANEDKINKQCGISGDLLQASLFTCGRCKSVKTTSTQKQTRSADEPMTVFVLCLNCGKRWKC